MNLMTTEWIEMKSFNIYCNVGHTDYYYVRLDDGRIVIKMDRVLYDMGAEERKSSGWEILCKVPSYNELKEKGF